MIIPDGQWSMDGHISLIYQGNDCKKGFQCLDPANPAPCLPGTFSSNLKSIKCDNCRPGANCSEISEIESRECAIGYECSNPADPKPCSPGTFNPNVNAIICIQCPKGNNCTENSEEGFQNDANIISILAKEIPWVRGRVRDEVGIRVTVRVRVSVRVMVRVSMRDRVRVLANKRMSSYNSFES